VDRAAQVASRAEFTSMGAAGHYLLYRPAAWNRFALRASLGVLDRAAAERESRREGAGPTSSGDA
jgi:hypothetical protein